MDESIETVVNGSSDKFSSWNKLSVEFVKNILKILSFSGFFGMEQLKIILDKRMCHKSFQHANIDGFVDDQLQEKVQNRFDMFPFRVHIDFFVFSSRLFRLRKEQENKANIHKKLVFCFVLINLCIFLS